MEVEEVVELLCGNGESGVRKLCFCISFLTLRLVSDLAGGSRHCLIRIVECRGNQCLVRMAGRKVGCIGAE
jgi:hypothetical protein